MQHYVTHYFAHQETLDRAERWLLQRGYGAGQMTVHREGVPWISVLVAPGKKTEVEMIFNAAELNDPDGWPSFWELARVPHPHVEPQPDATATVVATAHPTPVGWHPIEAEQVAEEDDYGLTAVWDVSTRFR
jgi:hypothetical protein